MVLDGDILDGSIMTGLSGCVYLDPSDIPSSFLSGTAFLHSRFVYNLGFVLDSQLLLEKQVGTDHRVFAEVYPVLQLHHFLDKVIIRTLVTSQIDTCTWGSP